MVAGNFTSSRSDRSARGHRAMLAWLRHLPVLSAIFAFPLLMRSRSLLSTRLTSSSSLVEDAVPLLGPFEARLATVVSVLIVTLDLIPTFRRAAGMISVAFFSYSIFKFSRVLVNKQTRYCNCFVNELEPVNRRSLFRSSSLLILSIVHANLIQYAHISKIIYKNASRIAVCVLSVTNIYLLVRLAYVRRSNRRNDPIVSEGEIVPHFRVLSKNQGAVDLLDSHTSNITRELTVIVGAADCGGCKSVWNRVRADMLVSAPLSQRVVFIWLGGVPQIVGDNIDLTAESPVSVGSDALRETWEFADILGAAQGAFRLNRVPAMITVGPGAKVLSRPSIGELAVIASWDQLAAES